MWIFSAFLSPLWQWTEYLWGSLHLSLILYSLEAFSHNSFQHPLSILTTFLNWHTYSLPRTFTHSDAQLQARQQTHKMQKRLPRFGHINKSWSRIKKPNPSFKMEINTFTSISITFPFYYQHLISAPVSFMIMMLIMMIITVVMMVMMIVFVITLLIDCGRVTGAIFHPLNSFSAQFSGWRREGGALTGPDLLQREYCVWVEGFWKQDFNWVGG